MKFTYLLYLTVPLLAAGCLSTDPKTGVDDVRKTVAARLGQPVVLDGQHIAATNLSAEEAVTLALLNNHGLRMEFERIGISQAELAGAARLQNIELTGSWRFPDRPPSLADVEYSVSGNFLDLLTLSTRRKMAGASLEQTKLEVADKVLEIAAETKSAVYALQAQLAVVKQLNLIAQANGLMAEVAERQFQAGNIHELELRERELAAAPARMEAIRAQRALIYAHEKLTRLLGTEKWTVHEDLPPMPANEPATTNLETVAVTRRLDLAARKKQVESVAAALKLKQHIRYFPGVSLGIDSEQMPDGQRITGPTLGLEIPIFNQGQPGMAKLSAEWRRAKAAYEAKELDVRCEVREAVASLKLTREMATFVQTNLNAHAQESVEMTLQQYNAMQKSSYDLLQARAHEALAQQEEIESLKEYWLAHVALERAVGGKLSVTP